MRGVLDLGGVQITGRANNKIPRENGRVKNTSYNLSYFTDTGDRECIKQVIDITKPTTTICIHSEAPEQIKELTNTAIIIQDGEIYQVK